MNVGLVGWRGMVGSVLLDRMRAERDLEGVKTTFFSTSQVGQPGPDLGGNAPLEDAFDVDALQRLDVVITCQGGDYTNAVHPKLRDAGWEGYWIDAASALRMQQDSLIVLDPVNREVIDRGLASGVKDYIGGNCTVSLMLMAIVGLIEKGWVEWITAMTYQSASGAGAKHVRELLGQMSVLAAAPNDAERDILKVDAEVSEALRSAEFPQEHFGAPLAASLIPWIDRLVEDGQTREEWKGQAEVNKILGLSATLPVDGICVRVPAMRCHSQALTIKLTSDVPLAQIEAAIGSAHDWVRVVPNDKESTLRELTPASVNATLQIPVGRLRKLKLGPEYLTCFTVGDQLLWGAAEPLRRMFRIVRAHEAR